MLKYVSGFVDRVITAYRLGFSSLVRVIVYKVLVKYRLHSVVRIQESDESADANGRDFSRLEGYSFEHFWFFNRKFSGIPECHGLKALDTVFLTNWFNGYVHPNKALWYEIHDFDSKAGDIKGVWELSRWYWAILIACDSKLRIDERCELLDQLLGVWRLQNPFLRGPNWKCGQEVALRLIHYLVALRLLGYSHTDLRSDQRDFIHQHLRRIAPTLNYAKGQKNNHWISEAVGLIVGGLWVGPEFGKNHFNKGVKELSSSIECLFNTDGSFAQSSFNYLRHALTLIAIAKLEMSADNQNCLFLDSAKLSNALFLFSHFTD